MTSVRTKVKPPSSISATVSAVGGFAVNVAWTPRASAWPVGYYNLYRDEELIATSLTATTYRDTDVVEGADYQYAIATVNVHEIEGEPSAIASISVPAFPVWETGWSVSILQDTTESIASRASDPDGDALTFSRIGGTAPASVTVSSAGVVAVGTTAAGSYTLMLRADDGLLTADTTITLTVTAAITTPGEPINFSATAISATQINLSWQPNPVGSVPDDYDLNFSTVGGNGPWTGIAIGLVTAHSHTGLTASTQYWYRIRAGKSGAGSSAYVAANATTPAAGALILLDENFSSTTWYTKFHNPQTKTAYSSQPARVTRVTSSYSSHGYVPRSGGSGNAIQVQINQGTNEGTTMSFYPRLSAYGSDVDEMFLRYYLRLGSTWQPHEGSGGGGKYPGISGDYGDGAKGNVPSDGTNGWSARCRWGSNSGGTDPLSFGSYVYHADMTGQSGEGLNWLSVSNGMARNQWYRVELYLKRNTNGQNNGVLRGWIDGVLKAERTNYRFTDNSAYRIERAWFDVYHGGGAKAPQTMHLFITDVYVSTDQTAP